MLTWFIAEIEAEDLDNMWIRLFYKKNSISQGRNVCRYCWDKARNNRNCTKKSC